MQQQITAWHLTYREEISLKWQKRWNRKQLSGTVTSRFQKQDSEETPLWQEWKQTEKEERGTQRATDGLTAWAWASPDYKLCQRGRFEVHSHMWRWCLPPGLKLCSDRKWWMPHDNMQSQYKEAIFHFQSLLVFSRVLSWVPSYSLLICFLLAILSVNTISTSILTWMMPSSPSPPNPHWYKVHPFQNWQLLPLHW